MTVLKRCSVLRQTTRQTMALWLRAGLLARRLEARPILTRARGPPWVRTTYFNVRIFLWMVVFPEHKQIVSQENEQVWKDLPISNIRQEFGQQNSSLG